MKIKHYLMLASASVAAFLASSCDRSKEYNYITNINGVADTTDSASPAETCDTLMAVDMGLSVKWASMNVGAPRPELCGFILSWGETEHKTTFTINSYKWYDKTSGEYTKYTKEDGLTALEAEDDAATLILGEKWRTPTYEEMKELAQPANCMWVYTEDYKGTGICGFNVYSNRTGNCIFIPLTGLFYDNSSVDYPYSNHVKPTSGYYWTANSIFDDYSENLVIDCYNSTPSICLSSKPKYYGAAIRAVTEDK